MRDNINIGVLSWGFPQSIFMCILHWFFFFWLYCLAWSLKFHKLIVEIGYSIMLWFIFHYQVNVHQLFYTKLIWELWVCSVAPQVTECTFWFRVPCEWYILELFIWVCFFLDGILIYSKYKEEYEQHLRIVLRYPEDMICMPNWVTSHLFEEKFIIWVILL